VQNVLLALGGSLLAIAAIAFTLVSWGHLGISGRSAVLTVLTVLALACPAVLLRRGLASTAEAVAALGLVLTVLDAYALYQVALPGTDSLAYTAGASAVLAAGWAGYATALSRLRLPLAAALVAAQLPLLLWALSAGAGTLTVAWVLLATAALDTTAALWTKSRPVRAITGIAGWVTAGGALLTGGELSLIAGSAQGAAGPAALLLAGAGLGVFAAWRADRTALACTAVAGLASVAAVGGVLRAATPDDWTVPGYLLCAIALLAVARTSLPRPVVRGRAIAVAVVMGVAVAGVLPTVTVVLLGAVSRVTEIWAGSPGGARQTLGAGLPWSPQDTAPLVLAAVAGALLWADRWLPGAPGVPGVPTAADGEPRRRRAAPRCAAVALCWASVLTLPAALDLGYPAALALPLIATAAGLTLALRPHAAVGPAAAATALVCALVGAANVALLSLAGRTATLSTLAVLSALFGGAALAAERVPGRVAAGAARVAPRPGQALLACATVGWVTLLVVAGGAAARWPAEWTAVALLAVPAVAALLGARLRRHPAGTPIEIVSAGACLVAIILSTARPPAAALVLALSGVIAAGSAVRPERRRVAGRLAAVLFVSAAWVRLAVSDVSSPEAYTLPVTIPALAVGLLRRRRDPEASSWRAYGPGLTATLLPSLIAVWGDTHWTRPLLLGLAALAVTLAGARSRLRAPLLLGAVTLALDSLHELTPYAVQVAGVLPRWLPPALAGLLLIAVGATYEQRLRDARRVRRNLGRMR
jgi:hypothetical protein